MGIDCMRGNKRVKKNHQKKNKAALSRPPRRKPYLQTAGLPPGSLVHTGERKTEGTCITLIRYSDKEYEERRIGLDEIPGPDGDAASVQWIHAEGLSDVAALEAIGHRFGLHSLVLEDILNTEQRPKLEDYGPYVYAVVKVVAPGSNEINVEQASFILGDGFVLSFAERDTDLFMPVIGRLRQDIGRVRRTGADYLFYTLLDVIVDNYFVVLEELGEQIEVAEDELVSRPTADTLKDIYDLKRRMLTLHKALWPFREVANTISRGGTKLVCESTAVYTRDLYDHVIQAMDMTDTLRDILSSMLDIYLSSTSNRMNEIMKVLTIISTIFMPLSFIVGVYGMNFTHMPELNVPWAYPAVWGVIVLAAGAMMVYFKRKKWW